MAEELNQEPEQANANTINIKDILKIGLRKWPWILLSIAVCLGLATLYLMRTTPIYTREATIRIKTDSNGGSISSNVEGFSDLGLIQSNTNVADEIASLESSDFMKEVVKRLNLTFSYSKEGRFHDEVAYGISLPVMVMQDSVVNDNSGSFKLHVAADGKVSLSDFVKGDREYSGEEFTGNLGSTIETPLGGLVVVATPNYKEGETVDLSVAKSSVSAAAGSCKAKLNISLKDDKGNIIKLVCTDESPERAEDILNALIAVYNENWIREKNQIAVSTSNFINERLNVIESELGNVDQDISSFKSEHLIPDVNQASSMYMAQSSATADQLVALGTQLQMARYIKNFMTDQANNFQMLPVNVGLEAANIESQITAYNTTLQSRNSLVANSSAKNPAVKDLDAQLDDIRNAIVASIDNHIVALNTKIRDLEKSERQTTSRIAANPTQARYLLSVERQQKVKEALYLFLLQKREENELSQAFTAYNTSVIESPHGSSLPTSPVSRNIYAIAFLAGLLIPFGIIYIREASNTKLRGRKDLEGLAIPFIGEIPYDKPDKKEKDSRLVVSEGNRDVVNEAFRVLRTNLDFISGGENSHSVIMVTSFNPSSGKTFLTMNIAMSLALKGKKVLVIDGDLRRASASEYVDSPKAGLTNWLIGAEKDIDNLIVCDTLHDNLCVLPVGKIPPNPTELLENGKLRELLEELKKEYDYIFIDCPPVEMMADAQILAKEADRTLFVVRAGLLERSMIPELDKMYKEKKYRNMGLILNGTSSSDSRYGYGYRNGYGYGRYGHYGNYGSKKNKKG